MATEDCGESKTPLSSKTLHFNWISSASLGTMWGFLPESVRQKPIAIASVILWLSVGNIILRCVTNSALKWRKDEKPE